MARAPLLATRPKPIAAGEDPRQHYGLTLAALAVSALAFTLMQTMVVPALPQMQRDLNASTSSVTWVLTFYMLSASVATPVLGRLGDMFGKERLLILVMAVFGVGSVVAALSDSLAVLVAGRVIQGAGGAVFPLAFGIIRDELPPERVATGIGLISGMFGIGGGAGLVLSGLIVDHLSYEWIFWLGALATVVAIVATHLFVPESPVRTPTRIDWLGAALLAAGLVSLLLGVTEGNRWGWGSLPVLALFAGGLAVLGFWARYESRVHEPLVNMALMRLRSVWTTNVTGLLVGFGVFGSFFLIPQFAQAPAGAGYGFASSATESSLFLIPWTAVTLVAAPLAGALGDRFGSKFPLQIGAVIATGAFTMLALAHAEPWQVYMGSALMGLGSGFLLAAQANLIVGAVPQTHTGEATGMNAISRTIGGALGAQVVAAILAGQLVAGLDVPAQSGYTTAFLLCAAGMLLAFAAGRLIPRRQR